MNAMTRMSAAFICSILVFIVCLILCSGTVQDAPSSGAETPYVSDVTADGETTDVTQAEEHEEITRDLIAIVNHDPKLKSMLETSIAQAHALNPDPDTNPVSDLELYYAFLDRCYKAMPWEISPSETYSSLYDRIDQGMGCLYFICDQPLRELEDKGYYHNSVLYHEPFRSWWIRYLSGSGQFLSTPESWNDTYYQTALANPDFQLDGDLFESPDNWHSFNDFFARRLSDPAKRPIAEGGDGTVVVSPADSTPQGYWKIDSDSLVISADAELPEGIAVKTGTLQDVSVLLEGSAYAHAFENGALTHTFLDINDYHRYHFPVSGTVREVFVIPQDDAPGGVITWDPEAGRYREYGSEQFGWQSIETRGVCVVELDHGGYAALVPVGMCQVSSVNFEPAVRPGVHVNKGDPMGFFLFGGSDIIMIFSEDLSFELTAQPGNHILMGEALGTINR